MSSPLVQKLAERNAAREVDASIAPGGENHIAYEQLVRAMLLAQNPTEELSAILASRHPGAEVCLKMASKNYINENHLLIAGPPGSGKLALFELAAREVAGLMGREVVTNPAPGEDVQGKFLLYKKEINTPVTPEPTSTTHTQGVFVMLSDLTLHEVVFHDEVFHGSFDALRQLSKAGAGIALLDLGTGPFNIPAAPSVQDGLAKSPIFFSITAPHVPEIIRTNCQVVEVGYSRRPAPAV